MVASYFNRMSLLFIGSLLGTTSSFATGGMSGGGAGLVLDKNNPWYLDNTSEVRYCVEVAPDVFSASSNLIFSAIKKAISYWKEEYAHAVVPQILTAIRPVKIATQTFVSVPCNEPFDMSIQFGVLHADQRADFVHPEEFAGAAIRTSYDPKTMRAKGYIYIAPDRGLLRYKGAPKNIKDFWSHGQGGLLYRTLVHEFGHVFGLAHQEHSVMSERYIETIMSDNVDYFASFYDAEPFFRFSEKSKGNAGIHGINPISQKARDFLELDAQTYGLFMAQSKPGTLLVKTTGKEWNLKNVAEIELEKSGNNIFRNAQVVYLPQGNEVYKIPASYPNITTLPGPFIQDEVRHGTYRSLDGQVQRDVVVSLNSNGPQGTIGAVIDQRYEMNLLDIWDIGDGRSHHLMMPKH